MCVSEAVLFVLALIFVVAGVHVSDEESCGPYKQDFENVPTLKKLGDPVRLLKWACDTSTFQLCVTVKRHMSPPFGFR